MSATSILSGKGAAYYTLGCKLNFSETSTFEHRLQGLGVHTVKSGETADICIINTCAVTEVAVHKCKQIIKRMARRHPNALIVVTGCFAQIEPEAVAGIPGVGLVLGSNEKVELPKYIAETLTRQEAEEAIYQSNCQTFFTEKTKDIVTFSPSCSRGNRTRYFLKVQDGCNCFCTYCTIPLARGFSRNPSIASLVEQTEQAAQEGGKEIVLTGVNIGDFGQTTGERLIDLLKALDKIEAIKRFRISSIEPDLLDDDIIAWCKDSRAFMPHFHIPLQSGADEVLRLMHRRYDSRLFAKKIEHIKTLMPHAFIGVDVMVGMRGETIQLFEESYRFIESLDITQLHVFPYSERPNTAALKIPLIVGEKEKKERVHRLLQLSEKKTLNFYSMHRGTTAKVLFEKSKQGKAMHGFTENYIRAELSETQMSPDYDNKIIEVRLGDFNTDKNALMVSL